MIVGGHLHSSPLLPPSICDFQRAPRRTTSSLQGTSTNQQDLPKILSSREEDALFRQPLSVLTFGIGVSVGVTIVLLAILWKIAKPTEEDNKETPYENRSLQLEEGSRTAILALYARSQAYQCGYGPDHLAPVFLDSILTETTPSAVQLAVQACGFMTRLNYRLTHRIFEDQVAYAATLGNTGLVAPMHARTSWLDDCVREFVAKYPEQKKNVIILGSGFDSRGYRLEGPSEANWYEVDAPGTLAAKKRVLQMAGINKTAVSVDCNFETEDWLQRLVQVGLDVSLPTLIVWEGVTMYLSKGTVEETLQKVSHNPQWWIAFDYIDKKWADSKLWRSAMTQVGEPFQFAMTAVEQEPDELLKSCHLQLLEHWPSTNSDRDNVLAKRYFPVRAQDQPVGFLGNYGGFVLAKSLATHS